MQPVTLHLKIPECLHNHAEPKSPINLNPKNLAIQTVNSSKHPAAVEVSASVDAVVASVAAS